MNARCRASDNCSKDKCKRNLVDVNNIEAVHHELLWFHEQGYYRLKETYHQYVLDQCGNRGGGRTARGSRQSNSSTTAANSANSSAGIVLDSSSSSAALLLHPAVAVVALHPALSMVEGYQLTSGVIFRRLPRIKKRIS